MVSATIFYADQQDVDDLLEYLGVGRGTVLRPWPLRDAADELSMTEAQTRDHVLIVSESLGEPVLADASGLSAAPRSAVSRLIHQMNLERATNAGVSRIVDVEASPVLFWRPGRCKPGELLPGSIGSQADQPKLLSPEYERWIARVTSWIRRRGTPVWGLEGKSVRPDLDVSLSILNTIYALPGAMRMLEAGARGRGR